MGKRRHWRDILTLNAYWIGHSFMWNSLHPIVLPILMLSFAEQAKNTAYGLLTFAGLLIALVAQPFYGALSDRTRHRLGRRRPWVLLGAVLCVLWLVVMALARRFWLVATGYGLLQLSSNMAHGPAQALIPDLVPHDMRGIASGVKNLFDMLGVILAAIVVGRILGGGATRPWGPIAVMGIVLLGAMAVTVLGVREPTLPKHPAERESSPWARVRAALRIDLRGHGNYARLLLARFFVLLGTFAVQSFALYYIRDVFEADVPARIVGNMMLAIGLCVALAVLPAGALSERWGRRGLSLVACGLTIVGLVLLGITRNVSQLWPLGCLIGLGMGIFTSVNWAWATDLVPAGQAGKYLGLSNLATAGSAAVSRLLGPFIDLVNARVLNGGYVMLFALAALVVFLGLLTTLGIPETRPARGARLLPSVVSSGRGAGEGRGSSL